MIHPSVEDLRRASGPGVVVPVWREVMADGLTPVLAYRSVASADHSYLLESVVGGEKWGRYSFVGIEPDLVFRSRGRRVEIARRGRTEVREDVDPLETLRAILARYRPATDPALPRFWGGAVGYLGYDAVRFIERLPDRHPPDPAAFDCILTVGGTVLVFDALRQTIKVVVAVLAEDPAEASPLHDEARGRIASIVGKLRRPPRLSPMEVPPPGAAPERWPEPRAAGFRAAVDRAREAIRAGEVIQVVLSQRWEVPRSRAEPFEVYRTLRILNPSPYMFFLGFPEGAVLGASPEVLVRMESGMVEVRPIAGTRRRGESEVEDLSLETELRGDEKEAAEHLMLVDLARNDVGRIARPGGVEVADLRTVERYSHVMHLVSSVKGRLAHGHDAVDVFKAVFPAGTLAGAPKVRAMELIDELEDQRRGVYGGAVGYFGFDGNADLCIAIRTIVERGERYLVQSGAGIVWDSRPDREDEETRNKAAALLAAIEWAGRPESA